MKRRHIRLRSQITIDKIYTFHYNELAKNYIYAGEKHNFWEFLYVDKGEVEITTDRATFHLKQGDIVFYSPNEFHSLQCNRRIPPNIFIIAFDSKSPPMRFFSGKSLSLGDEERRLLSRIIEEGDRLFVLPVDRTLWSNPARKVPVHPLKRKIKPDFGSEQLIKNYLEALFIQLLRNNSGKPARPRLTSVTKQKSQSELVSRIPGYIEERLLDGVTVDMLCAEFSMSQAHLRSMFSEQTGKGVAEYIGALKIERAKQFIREETCNLTEIAERLGYSSIHYFSRHFKKVTGMPPSEYLKTMQAQR